ncbi:MAG: hypothetical protein KDJ52_10550 [Anaerolineae bacterium]|nr:hypothetical protein [Anaerolineae bacterium]
MKRYLLILGVAIVVTFTALFSLRASVDALAVVIGVILGVVASVPTTFLFTYLVMRQHTQQAMTMPGHQTAAHPPIVVINGSEKPAMAGSPILPPPAGIQGRSWTVIGDVETDPVSRQNLP